MHLVNFGEMCLVTANVGIENDTQAARVRVSR